MPTVPAPGSAANAAITACGALHRFGGRREHLVDDRHLRRMDRHLAGEAVAARLVAFAAQPGIVAEIHIDRVDRLHLRRRRAGKAKAARKLIGREEISVAVAVGLGAELHRQILRAPGQALQTLARTAISAGEKNRLRGLGRDRDDVERAVGQPVDRFARRELGIAMDDRGAAFRLGKHDAVGSAGDDRSRSASVSPVAKPLMRTKMRGRGLTGTASLRKASVVARASALRLRRDRIFEIEKQRIGAAAQALFELLRAVAGNEKEGAHRYHLFLLVDGRCHWEQGPSTGLRFIAWLSPSYLLCSDCAPHQDVAHLLELLGVVRLAVRAENKTRQEMSRLHEVDHP